MRLLSIWVGGATRMENGEAARHLGVWGCTYGSASSEAARHLGGWGSMYGGARRVRLLDKNSSPCLFFYIFSM